MHLIWEINFGTFLFVTIILGGGAAYLTGRAVALTWRQLPQLIVFVVLLSIAVRFIHFALFAGSFFKVDVQPDGTVAWGQLFTALHYWVADIIVLLILAGLGFRFTRAQQMTRQYSWIYERAGGLAWRQRTGDAKPPA